jgi:glycosidase
MPINDSPSYHGYDAVDYRSINPDYGTLVDFETFLAAAHARGIRVIVDYVMNHCSDQHPWFVASAQDDPYYRDWFRWEESDPGETGPWGQDVWHRDGPDWYYGLFWSGMPDLNYETPAVKTEMFDTATWWLDTVGVDGFRLDAVLYIVEEIGQLQNTNGTLQFWQDYNAHVKSVNPGTFSVGEAWTASTAVIQYVIDDRLDLCFEFELSYAMLNAVNGADADYLRGKAAQVYNLYPYLQYAPFLTNHDQDRSFTVLGEDPGKAKAAAGIYLTQPGVPFLYYGEEIGMTGSGAHENIRTPMQWTDGPHAGFTTGTPWRPVNGDYPQYNVQDEAQDPTSLLAWYRKLIHVRNGSTALRHGTLDVLASSAAPVLAHVRDDGVQTVLCLVNTSENAQDFALTGSEGSLTPGTHTVVDLLNPADTRELTVTPAYEITGLGLPAFAVRVYEFETATDVDPGDGAPPRTGLRLEQNHPNPFNPSTTIRYTLPAPAHVRLGIYDAAGREVAVIRDEVQPEGEQFARWDGVDGGGQPVGTGVYFVRLDADGESRRAKMTLVR